MSKKTNIGIIGAGIQGVSNALFLQKKGFKVTIFDRDNPGAQAASYGNAGHFSPYASVPINRPDVLTDVPAMLMSSSGPLALKWNYIPKMIPWFLKFISNSTSLWSDANTMLDGMMGAHLVTITSEEENTFLTEFVTQDTWIGLNDVAEEGVFEWVTGEELTYTNWREGEPNNYGGNEPYVHMFRQGDWNDGQPDNEYFYIVEVESGSELSYVVEDGLQDHTEYFWQVTARDMSGATYATPMQTFMVNSANENPEGFTLVSPENGSVISSYDQLLVWNLSTDLDGDFIEFDVHLNGESIGVTDHNYMHVSGLVEDTTYVWSVTATDNNDGFTQSDLWSFTVNTMNSAPQPFALLSPESETMFNETSVTFEWEVSEDVDGTDEVMYHLEIHSDSLSMHYETYETSFIVDNLMDNHTCIIVNNFLGCSFISLW